MVVERVCVLDRGGGRGGREVVLVVVVVMMERVEVEPTSIIDQVITRGVVGISHDAKVVGRRREGVKRDTLGIDGN